MAGKRGGVRLSRAQKRAVGDESQRLARVLMDMKETAFSKIPMDDDLREEVVAARKVTANIARRREERRLGARLRVEELDEINAAILADRDINLGETKAFKQAERWRAELLADDGKQGAFLKAYADLDAALLKELVDNGRHEDKTGQPVGAMRKLFRFVRDAMGAA